MKRNKDCINADEGDPEVQLAKALVHHPAEHLWKPEVRRREHSENRGDTHHQVEVRGHEIRIVKKEVE